MEAMTDVRDLTPNYRIRMAGNAVRNDDVVWQYQRMLVGGIIKKRLSWNEVHTMRNRVERLKGCNRVWDTETYEASHVKVLLRTFLCKDRFCPNCQAVKRTVLWNRLQPYMEQNKDSLYHMTLTVPDCTAEELYDILHIIYGYMKVGEILRDPLEIKARCPQHPHAYNAERGNNRLYIPDAYGTFRYDDKLVLTKKGQDSRRLWALPPFFAEDGISISWQGDNRPVLKNGYAELNSVCRGQEFVITTSTAELQQKLLDWVEYVMA